jgi:hypothetical protein
MPILSDLISAAVAQFSGYDKSSYSAEEDSDSDVSVVLFNHELPIKKPFVEIIEFPPIIDLTPHQSEEQYYYDNSQYEEDFSEDYYFNSPEFNHSFPYDCAVTRNGMRHFHSDIQLKQRHTETLGALNSFAPTRWRYREPHHRVSARHLHHHKHNYQAKMAQKYKKNTSSATSIPNKAPNITIPSTPAVLNPYRATPDEKFLKKAKRRAYKATESSQINPKYQRTAPQNPNNTRKISKNLVKSKKIAKKTAAASPIINSSANKTPPQRKYKNNKAIAAAKRSKIAAKTVRKAPHAVVQKNSSKVATNSAAAARNNMAPFVMVRSGPNPYNTNQRNFTRLEGSFDSFHTFRRYFWDQNQSQITDSLRHMGCSITDLRLCPVSGSVQGKFMRRLGELGVEPAVAYHGTNISNMQNICDKGFLVPNKGGIDGIRVTNGSAYGIGIYTSKTADYSTGYCRATSTMFVCAVIEAEDNQKTPNSWPDRQFPGRMNVTSHGNIVVLFNEAQVIPLFLLDFQWKHHTPGINSQQTLPTNNVDLDRHARKVLVILMKRFYTKALRACRKAEE